MLSLSFSLCLNFKRTFFFFPARQQSPSREYLPSFQGNNNGALNRPRPFQRPQQSLNPQGTFTQSNDQSVFNPFNNDRVTTKEPQYNPSQTPKYN